MECHSVQKMISVYLDGELKSKEHEDVKAHLDICENCQKEAEAYQNSWEMLGELEQIEPRFDYVSRFWTELSHHQKWYEKLWDVVKQGVQPRLVPVLATVCVMVIISVVALRNYSLGSGVMEVLVELNEDEIEMVENMELAEHLDMIEDLEFWEDWEIIKHLENGQV